ncbi:MAG: zinc-ribbon domain-containing protein [Thermoplasmata archaeon]
MSVSAGRGSLRKMYWTPPLRTYTIVINIGLVLFGAAAFDWIFFRPTVPVGAAFPWTQLIPVALVGLAGLVLFAVGIAGRNRRVLRLLPHPCLQCGTLNAPDARFCSQCGARFEVA